MKETTPSKVKLTLFGLYRARVAEGQLRAVQRMVGAYDVRLGDDGRAEVLTGSVPFNDRRFDPMAPKAGFGILALFGIRDTIEELQRWRAIGRNSNAEFAYAELWVDVAEIEVKLANRESLKAPGRRSRFLNLRRTTVDFQKDVLATFQRYVREEGGDPDATMARVQDIASRPDLFDRLLYEDADLRDIDVFVLPLADMPDSPGRMRQVAYLRPGAKIVEFAQGSDQVSMFLPTWMSDLAEAQRQRAASTAAAA
ncbi:MAG TPA: hypothetical protein VHQ87_16035 [Rhizobacter sp.]|nr:hypothetical protein [Rhizobacter sp.]